MNKQGRGGQMGYNNQHRQDRNQQQPMQQQQAAPGQTGPLTLPSVNADQLDSLKTAEERENFVGNSIYNAIFTAFGEHEAPTITGMILDESAVDYKQLLTD